MRLKLYRAAAMPEAMAHVRADLGEDALILATRPVAGGVEVTAALDPDDDRPPPLPLPDPVRLAALEFHGVPVALRQALLHGDLETALSRALPFGTLPLHDRPLLLIGPPGAGKTTVVARLATRLVLASITPLVITADGQRAGATEQLAAFTRLLGISLVVACQPVSLGRATARRQAGTPVLIDTPGCDPFDAAQTQELATLAATVGGEMVLVLPAGLDPAEAADQAKAYAALGVRLMVATRCDLSRRLGGVLTAASHGLVLTEAGIGPGAADGLIPLTPAWLAARLLTGPHA
ncbi:MAG TPA: GTP-binding protein [Acetobacteraceae bacterium]|nr:GTP-binding protein [Acetobacteraceae bacterium]